MAIRKIIILTLVFFAFSCERNLKTPIVSDNNNLVEPAHQEKDIKVDFALADMIEEVVRKTKFSINISDMTRKTINIDKIDGLYQIPSLNQIITKYFCQSCPRATTRFLR